MKTTTLVCVALATITVAAPLDLDRNGNTGTFGTASDDQEGVFMNDAGQPTVENYGPITKVKYQPNVKNIEVETKPGKWMSIQKLMDSNLYKGLGIGAGGVAITWLLAHMLGTSRSNAEYNTRPSYAPAQPSYTSTQPSYTSTQPSYTPSQPNYNPTQPFVTTSPPPIYAQK